MGERIGRNILKKKEHQPINGEKIFAMVLHLMNTENKVRAISQMSFDQPTQVKQIVEKTGLKPARVAQTIQLLRNQDMPLITYEKIKQRGLTGEFTLNQVGDVLLSPVIPIFQQFHQQHPDLTRILKYQQVPMHYALVTALRHLRKQSYEENELRRRLVPYFSLFDDTRNRPTTRTTLSVLKQHEFIDITQDERGIKRLSLTEEKGKVFYDELISPARQVIRRRILNY